MTGWPTLDGPDAERAIGAACLRMGEPTTSAWSADLIAALNDADVVLCNHTALAALRQRAIDAEVYKAALVMACIDGWADGAGAFEHYVGCARQAVASAQDAPTPQTERVPLAEALGRRAPHNGGTIIGVYMELDDMRPVLNTSNPNLDKFMADRSDDGTVEVLA